MKPGLAHAFLVGFIESIADFGNPVIVGGSYAVLSTDIFFAIVGAQYDQARREVTAGPVKVAVRPEFWRIGAPGTHSLAGELAKLAHLGGHDEPTVSTALGEVFVLAADVTRQWQVGEPVGLSLGEAGLAVVQG
jgi:hypothetical protein